MVWEILWRIRCVVVWLSRLFGVIGAISFSLLIVFVSLAPHMGGRFSIIDDIILPIIIIILTFEFLGRMLSWTALSIHLPRFSEKILAKGNTFRLIRNNLTALLVLAVASAYFFSRACPTYYYESEKMEIAGTLTDIRFENYNGLKPNLKQNQSYFICVSDFKQQEKCYLAIINADYSDITKFPTRKSLSKKVRFTYYPLFSKTKLKQIIKRQIEETGKSRLYIAEDKKIFFLDEYPVVYGFLEEQNNTN